MQLLNPFKKLFSKSPGESILLCDLAPSDLSFTILNHSGGAWHPLAKEEQRLPVNTFSYHKVRSWEELIEQGLLLLRNVNLQTAVHPKKTLLLLSNSWVKGVSLTVRIHRTNQEEEVTTSELEKLLEKIRKQTSQKAQERLLAQGFTGVSWELLNAEVLSYKVDGQPVSTPVGVKAGSLDFLLFFRFMERKDLGEILELLKDLGLEGEFFWEKSSFYSYGLSLLGKEGLVVNRGDDFTDLSAVLPLGTISINCSFSLGEGALRQEPEMYRQAFEMALAKISAERFAKGPIFLTDDLGTSRKKEVFPPTATLFPREEAWFKALEKVLGD